MNAVELRASQMFIELAINTNNFFNMVSKETNKEVLETLREMLTFSDFEQDQEDIELNMTALPYVDHAIKNLDDMAN